MATFSSGNLTKSDDGTLSVRDRASGLPSGTMDGYNDPYEAELAMQAATGGSGSLLGQGFDYSAGGDSNQPSLQELQAATAINTKLRQMAGTGSVPANIRDLNFRAGYMDNLTSTPFSLKGLLSGGFNPMSFGFLGQAGGAIGRNASRNLMKGLEKGYIPQYNKIGQVVATINPETGQYGAGSVVDRIDPDNPANEPVPFMDTGDDGGFALAPEATTVAEVEPEPEVSMVDPDLRYPAGGIYPEEGLYRRMGLLDIAPTQFGGLLAGYDQPQFAEMQAGFQRPVDVGLYDDPYDVTGYSLI
jgi:hypothetical protein